ncbi:MAG: hypothetical protein WD648_11920 [Planctomycetaceae bacterium]
MSTTNRKTPSPWRRLSVRILRPVFSIALAVVLSEALFSGYAYWKHGTISVEKLQELDTGNSFIEELDDARTGYAATLYPHPYLGYVHNEKAEGDPQRTNTRVNNVGLFGRDVPLRKDPMKFTVLLTGGSVAFQLGIAGEGGRSYLEIFLNDRYHFDREVVVLNAGAGAGKQPRQAITYMLYGDAADAVVTLEGFNEHYQFLGNGLRLEYPGNNFHAVNPIAQHGYEQLARSWQSRELKRFARQQNWRTVYYATSALRRLLEREPEPSRASLESYMSLPAKWPREERVAYNLEQYKKYIRSMNALADMNGAKRAFFIQPCPAIGKTLTAEEKPVVGDLDYASVYQHMTDELLTLRERGIPVVSLLDLFADTQEAVYADAVHCQSGQATDFSHAVNFRPSFGYRIMAEAMADRLAEAWNIPRRAAAPAPSP